MRTLIEGFGTNLEFGRYLAPLTSFGTGGRARYFITAENTDDIVRSIKAAKRLDVPFFVMGSGSNLLVSDSGYDGLVIKVDIKGMSLTGESQVRCGAGEDLMALVDFASANSLTGLEFAAGIWGTVGGAVYGNAGAYGGEIGSILSGLELVDNEGNVKAVGPDYCQFAYRHSYLKEVRETAVWITFDLQSGDKSAIEARVTEILALRKEKHPETACSAGCFFKNIPDATQPHGKLAAGKLLDEIGAKGMQVGGAKVFEKHANIIVNTGDATSKDIRQLADILKQKVFEKFGVELQEEVQQLGSF